MWLIKSTVSLLAMLALAYVLFFVEVGGAPFSQHLQDVWRSDTVQAKVELVHQGMRNELEDRLAEAAEDSARRAVREPSAAEEYAPEDKEALERVLAQ